MRARRFNYQLYAHSEEVSVVLASEYDAMAKVLREMVDRWEPDGGSDKRLWDRAQFLLGATEDDSAQQNKGQP